MESLGDIGWAIQTGVLAVQAGVERNRADRMERRADDWQVAAAVHRGAARGHARACADWYARCVIAEMEIDRLRDLVDERDLKIAAKERENAALTAAAEELLDENDRLRARLGLPAV